MQDIDPRLAIDLGHRPDTISADEQALHAAVDARREVTEDEAVAWDKAMTRAFKGIFPTALRRRYLREYGSR